MGDLAQYRVTIAVTYNGMITKGIFHKRNIPYSVTLMNDKVVSFYSINARSPGRAGRKAIEKVEKAARNLMAQMDERKAKGDVMILTGNTPDGKFIWSKPFISIDSYILGTPKVTKVKDWKDATLKELANSNLSIPEFQEVFDQINKRKATEK